MFWLRNKKLILWLCTLIWRPDLNNCFNLLLTALWLHPIYNSVSTVLWKLTNCTLMQLNRIIKESFSLSPLLLKVIKTNTLQKMVLIFYCHFKLLLLFDLKHTYMYTHKRTHPTMHARTLCWSEITWLTVFVIKNDKMLLNWDIFFSGLYRDILFSGLYRDILSSVPFRHCLQRCTEAICLYNLSSGTDRNLHTLLTLQIIIIVQGPELQSCLLKVKEDDFSGCEKNVQNWL